VEPVIIDQVPPVRIDLWDPPGFNWAQRCLVVTIVTVIEGSLAFPQTYGRRASARSRITSRDDARRAKWRR
jgi:hypothetical protein